MNAYPNMPPPNMAYHSSGSMGPPGPMDQPGGINSQPFVNGGHSMPVDPKSFDPAHQDLLNKYKKLKSKYFEVDGKCKDLQSQLDRAREQNVRLKEEKTGLLDRVVELEAALAQHLPPGAPVPPSSAFNRGFAYSRPTNGLPPILDVNGFARVLDEDDEDDPRRASRHIGAIAQKRKEDEEELRREEAQRRNLRKPRGSRNLIMPIAQAPSTMAYAYGPPNTPGSIDELYAAQQAAGAIPGPGYQPPVPPGYPGMEIDPAITAQTAQVTPQTRTRGKGKRSQPQQQQAPEDNASAAPQYPSYPDQPRARPNEGQQQGYTEEYSASRSPSPVSPVSGPHAQDSSDATPAKPRAKRQKPNPKGPVNIPFIPPRLRWEPGSASYWEVSAKENFHADRYIFPIGYEIQRRYPSTIDPNADALYTCSIVDGGDSPRFQIIGSDLPDRPVTAATPTGAWSGIVKAANELRGRNTTNSISGPDYFGLSQPTIKHLIQHLPGANQFKDYNWVQVIEGGPPDGPQPVPISIPMSTVPPNLANLMSAYPGR